MWEALRHHLRKVAPGPPLHEDDLSLGTSEDSSPREGVRAGLPLWKSMESAMLRPRVDTGMAETLGVWNNHWLHWVGRMEKS